MCLPLVFHSKGGPSSSLSSVPLVCRLVKSLYGLRQASRQWYAKLSATILQLGFSKSQSNYSLFVYTKGALFTAFLVYVDDMVITRNDPSCVATLKSLLDNLELRIQVHSNISWAWKLLEVKKGLVLIKESMHLKSSKKLACLDVNLLNILWNSN